MFEATRGRAVEEHDGSAHRPRKDKIASSSERKEELGRGEGAIAFLNPETLLAAQNCGEREVFMRVQDPFGLARRAARIVERAEVLAMSPRWL